MVRSAQSRVIFSQFRYFLRSLLKCRLLKKYSRLFKARKWSYSFLRFYQNVDNFVYQNVDISVLSKCRLLFYQNADFSKEMKKRLRLRHILNSELSWNPTFYNFMDEQSYVCISDQEVESYVSLQIGVSISANDGPSTVLRQAITAALSSLACKINIHFISRTVKLQSRAMAYFDRRTQDFKMTKRF